ncbi:MAG TPA: hypothetical protein VEH27_11205 [Methylomirabilota bacterium]|nr:hypothetical protein [Methylomirabilota bacterium]
MKTSLNRLLPISAFALLAATAPAFAASKDEVPIVNPAVEVSRGSLKAKVKVDGIFEAGEMAPIKVGPKVWADLTIVEATQHGATVKKGEKLVKFDLEKIQEQITDLEQDRAGSKLAMDLAYAELNNLRSTTPLKLEAAKVAHKVANEDFSYFETVQRAQRENNARFSLTNAVYYLNDQAEELKQLEKMYKQDHLTEETEEIVLKRQKFAVEAATFRLETTKQTTERELSVNIPRERQKLLQSKNEQDFAVILAEATLPTTLAKKEADLEKLRRDSRKSDKKLDDLREDLKRMDVTAPFDGIVYYGICQNGKWPTAAESAKKLVSGGKVAPHEVFMTVVNADKLIVRTTIPESELQYIKPGLKGEAIPTIAPDKKLTVTVEDVRLVPLPGGGFEAKLALTSKDGLPLAPGMNCTIHFNDVEKSAAMLVPKASVFTEGNDKVVYLASPNGKPEKRVVKTGSSDDNKVEITDGLKEGDKVLSNKPEEKAQ